MNQGQEVKLTTLRSSTFFYQKSILVGRVSVGLLKIKLAHITKKKLDFLVYLHHDMSYQEIYDARILQIKIKIQNDGKTKLIFIHVSEDINQLGTLITQKKSHFLLMLRIFVHTTRE